MQLTSLLNPKPRHAMAAHQRSLDTALHRLSTGKRINRAADDPAGLVAVEPMKARRLGIERSIQRLEMESLSHATRDGYLAEHSDLLVQLAGLVTQAGGRDVMSDEEKKALQIEVDSILDAMTHNSLTAEFQGVALLTGFVPEKLGRIVAPGRETTPPEPPAALQAVLDETRPASGREGDEGPDAARADAADTADPDANAEPAVAGSALASAPAPTPQTLTLADLRTGGRLNLIDGDLELAERVVDEAVDDVSGYRGAIGARSQAIEHERNLLLSELENITAAVGLIEDADFAKETAELVRAQVLREASTRAQAIAHENAQRILTLIRPPPA